MQQLDPHQRPPDTVRSLYKKVQKTKAQELPCDGHVIDLADTCRNALPKGVRVLREIETASLADAFCAFAGPDAGVDLQHHGPNSNIAVFEHHDMPGKMLRQLAIYTNLGAISMILPTPVFESRVKDPPSMFSIICT
jgi:alkylated DNA repair protein alkB family protein 1